MAGAWQWTLNCNESIFHSYFTKLKKEDLKIVFLGTPEFDVASLYALVTNGFNIVGVVTATDKPAGRSHKLLQSAVKEYALAHGLNLLQPEKLKAPEFLDQLRALDANLFIVIAFRMLPEVVWQMPRLGTFNLHGSLLPKYRGAAPINWAVINGEKETGVTTFFLKHEIDTGDIIDQERIEISDYDNVGTVYDRLMHLGAELTLKTVNSIIDGTFSTKPQDELLTDSEPTPAPKIFRETCEIKPAEPAIKIHNLVRGLSPYPAAWVNMKLSDSKSITPKIYLTSVTDKPTPASKTGKVFAADGHLYIGASDTLVEILELQAPGKKRMKAADFLRGTSVED